MGARFQELMHPDMDESSFTNSAITTNQPAASATKKEKNKRNGKRIMPSLYWKIMHRPFFLSSLNGWT
jgi:hypothetical protein